MFAIRLGVPEMLKLWTGLSHTQRTRKTGRMIRSRYPIGQMEKVDMAEQIKSKERVQKHGEVFTPAWMVEKMLAEAGIQAKLRDIHATFLEPSAGEGAFLTAILRQKLAHVNQSPSSRGAHWQYNALWALASIYGIEYLPDNLAQARANMLRVFAENYQAKTGRALNAGSDLYQSARFLIEKNIVQGNTLTHRNALDELIRFSEWRQDARRRRQVRRLEFAYDDLFADAQADGMNLFARAEQEDSPPQAIDLLQVWKLEAE